MEDRLEIVRATLSTVHLLAFMVGAGAAFRTDLALVRALAAPGRWPLEPEALKASSRIVWAGLAALAVTGAALAAVDLAHIAASSKFQIKMALVVLLTLNGWCAHRWLMPRLASIFFTEELSVRGTSARPPSPDERRLRRLGFMSGAISVTTWLLAIWLGAMRTSALPSLALLGVCFGALITATASSLLLETIHRAVQVRRSRQVASRVASDLLDEVAVHDTLFSRPRG